MNIENWPIGRIAQLPDWVFGRRWPIALGQNAINTATVWDITEAGLPDRTMIWEIVLNSPGSVDAVAIVGLRIGEMIPATVAEFTGLQPLFNDVVDHTGARSSMIMQPGSATALRMLRVPVELQGKKIIAQFTTASETDNAVQILMVISAVPKEVPDWILSGPVKDLL